MGGWNIYKFDQWASDPNLIATSAEDAKAHPEKYPYNSFSNGAQQLGTAVFQDINGDRVIDSKDMVPDSYTIIPETVLGVPVAQDSYGKVESRGFELVLGHRGNIGKDFKYFVEGQLTFNTNKITDIDETAPDVEWQRKAGHRIYDNTSVAELYEQAQTGTSRVGGWNIYKFDQWASVRTLIAT